MSLITGLSSWYFSWTSGDPHRSGFKLHTAVLSVLCVMFLVLVYYIIIIIIINSNFIIYYFYYILLKLSGPRVFFQCYNI